MLGWWSGLSALNQAFYAAAVFFSTIFIWQFSSSLSAVSGDAGDADVGGDMGADGDFSSADTDVDMPSAGYAGADLDDLVDDAPGLATFRLLSVRSILAFGTLFSWAGALYLPQDISTAGAMLRSLAWGLAGMAVVGAFFWLLPRLSEEGTSNPATAVGQTGQVYLDIPADGVGQIRVVYGGRAPVCACTHRGWPSAQGRHFGVCDRSVGFDDASSTPQRRREGVG